MCYRRIVPLLFAPLLLLGCAGHAAETQAARTALDAGQPKLALTKLNEKLDVDSADKLPSPLENEKVLFLLDRAMVQMQLGRYDATSRDLEACDKQLMILDFSRGTTDELGKFLFSDDTGPYRAPAYEKLLVNTMNMVSYLARGDLSGARVEARRLSVLSDYFKNSKEGSKAFVAPGSYLAGFIFEKSGNVEEALRYYDEALSRAKFTTLTEPVRRLAAKSTFRTPRLEELLKSEIPSAAATTPSPATTPNAAASETTVAAPPTATEPAEILVIINYGRVPAKIAERLPIGLALTYASGAISPYDVNRANRLAAQGLVTWVNYPRLGKPKGTWSNPTFALDNQWQTVDGALAVDLAAEQAWDEVKGKVIASAITRTIARIIAGQAANKATNDKLLGLLLSLGTQATLTAMDTPDTRSWSTLPARVAIGRVMVPAGTHVVELGAREERHRETLTLKPGGWATVVLTVLR
jgi:tetratricopeptide (TPR) repeat protein